MPDKTPVPLTESEHKFIRRLRSLQAGSHLIIINTSGDGPVSLTLLNSGKVERLAGERRPDPPPLQSNPQPG